MKCKVTKLTSAGVSTEESLTSNPLFAMMIACASEENPETHIIVESGFETED
jgi:hypothetical protein